jgi:hypothetical protein
MTKHIGKLLFGISYFCIVACSANKKDIPKVNIDNSFATVINSDDCDNLTLDIHETPCFGRNILEVNMTSNGSKITAKIVYRRNHSFMFNKAPDSIINVAQKEIGSEFDQIFFDTIVTINKKDLIESIKHAYKNRKSTVATAGYALIVDLIHCKDTITCNASNSDFIDIFKKYSN